MANRSAAGSVGGRPAELAMQHRCADAFDVLLPDLKRLAAYAQDRTPGADAAVVEVRVGGRLEVVGSNRLAERIARATRAPVPGFVRQIAPAGTPPPAAVTGWAASPERLASCGIQDLLDLPLASSRGTFGWLSLYGRAAGAFEAVGEIERLATTSVVGAAVDSVRLVALAKITSARLREAGAQQRASSIGG